MKDLVSVITPAFNSEKFIQTAYSSLLKQDYNNWEWLVTDDNSKDTTYDILLDLARSDCRIKVFQNHHNSGAAVSRNKSLENASGRFIAFLDSDDLWYEQKLSLQLEFMKSNNCAFSFTSFDVIEEDERGFRKVVDKNKCGPLSYEDMLKKNATLGCSTVMLDKKVTGDFSMPLIRTGQDYALWLSLLKKNIQAYHLPVVLTGYRILSNSISRNKFKKARRQWQIYREIEKITLLPACYYFAHYAYHAIFRK